MLARQHCRFKMPVDRAIREPTSASDLADGFSLAKESKSLAHCLAQGARCPCGSPGEIARPGIIRKNLPRAGFQMRRDFSDKDCPELGELLVSHAADSRKFPSVRRVVPGHLSQGDIRENDVRRHAALVGQTLAQGPEFLEQPFIALDFPGAVFGAQSERPVW